MASKQAIALANCSAALSDLLSSLLGKMLRSYCLKRRPKTVFSRKSAY